MRRTPSHRDDSQSAFGTGSEDGRGTSLERLSQFLERASDLVLVLLHALCETLPERLDRFVSKRLEFFNKRKVQNRIGLVLSLIGAVLVLVGLFLTFAPGGGLPPVLPLFIALFFTLGEQLRRGHMRPNPDPAPTSVASSGVIGGSVIVEFRPLSLRLHAFWSCLGLLYCLIVLGVPMLLVVGRIAVLPIPYLAQVGFKWLLFGFVALGPLVASFVSLYKKAHFMKMTRRREIPLGREAPHSAVWRLVTYSHRFDIMLAGLGGTVLSLAFMLPTVARLDSEAELMGRGLPLGLVALVVGVGLSVLALWMSSNYWKAAMPLSMVES